MTSILTNIAAMSALQTLRSIGQDMEATQGRVSSGQRVGTASDNAAYWSIATTMRSDNMALSAVQDALGLGAAKVDTAYAGMESAIEVVKEIKAKLVAATEDGVDKNKVQEEITQLQEQLRGISEAASFSGENWLQADLSVAGGTVTKDVVGSFVRDANGIVSVKKIDYTLDTDSVLFDTRATGTKTGILDKVYTVAEDGVTLSINTGGVTSEVTVKSFSIDSLIKSGAAFQGNYASVTTAAAGGAGVGDYVKVEGTWVLAANATTAPTQEIAATTTTPAAASWIVDTANAPTTTPAVTSLDGINIIGLSGTQINQMMKAVDAALKDMTSAAADLGSISMRIGLQEDFVSKLTDSIDSGVGRLVDAEMNEESTKLKALQTQQQLAIQSLSIANSSSESILSLFR
ncbi:flagellin [Agrobacterium tumefaciens]|uniref:flagellin N-terminal helical domain-containing protein n=1 Tax=Agrobacterium tumefaciens TaxID=358 RepID=UPI000FAC719C|nr:flagellin [Agrobacterium tumefaciens]NSX89609.1 flagellin [Agrobacterium tumefaciens]